MPAPLRFDDIPSPAAGGQDAGGAPTQFEAIPAPELKPDVPVPARPLMQKPLQGPETPEQAATRDFAQDQGDVQPGGDASVDDKLEQLLFNANIGGDDTHGEGTNRKLAVYKLAKATGLSTGDVEGNYDAISQAWQSALQLKPPHLAPSAGEPDDPEPYKRPGQVFREQQPELANALLRNPQASFVLKDKKISALHQALNAAADFTFDLPVLGMGAQFPPDVVEDIRKQREKRDNPGKELLLKDAQATSLDSGWTGVGGVLLVPNRVLVPFMRAKESWNSQQLTQAYDDLANLETLGRNTDDKWLEIADLEQKSVRRDYGENAVEQVFSDAADQASTVNVMLKGGAAGVAGAAAGAAITRTPAGARAGFSLGAKLGATYGTWHLERGSAYRDMLSATKNDGSQAMDPTTARLASGIYATLATGIEFASWGPMLTSMGPIGALIKTGDTKAFTEALIKNPTFMGQVKRMSKELAEVGMAEGGEEFLQDATQQAVEYFARSHGAGQFVTGNGEVNLDQSIEAWGKAVPSALVAGMASENVNLATQALFRDKAVVDGNKVRALAGLDKSDAAAAAPEVIADMFEQHTAKTGEPATHAHVTAKEFVRLFQENGGDADAAARHLLGPDGPERLAAAVASNGRLEVPIKDYVEKWVPAEVAKRLVEHTALSEAALTPAEAKALDLDKMADELAKRAVGTDEQTAATQFDRAEQAMVESGKFSPHEAALSMAPLRALVRTSAETFQTPAQKLFEQYSVEFAPGDQAQSVMLGAPADSRYLTRVYTGMSAEEQRRALYIDKATGVLNERAFARAKPEGRKYAAISVEGVKYSNDKYKHAAGDALYKAAAAALTKHTSEVYKPGGDFAAFVKDQAELDQVLSKANGEAVLKGFRLSGAIGETYRGAAELNNQNKAKAELAGERAARGARPLNATEDFAGGGEAVADMRQPEHLKGEFSKLGTEQAFNETYVDPTTGLLNRDGYEASPPRAFQLSGDLDGIKEMNDLLGEENTDQLIALAGNIMRELQGHEASMAHISGDEFQGKHDTEEALKDYGAHLQKMLEKTEVRLGVSESRQQKHGLPATVTLRGLPFSFGVGKTLDDAEQALHANKSEREAAGLRGAGKVRERLVLPAQEDGEGGRAGAVQGARDQVAAPHAVRLGEVPKAGGEAAAAGRQRFFDVGRLEQLERAAAREKDGLNRLEAPTDKGVPRGYTDVLRAGMERIFRIALNPNSDFSTFLHESGHVFLEVFGDLAERPDAPARVKEDYEKALKWLGTESRADIKREHHEKFARGFEAYLFEGKAPSPALARAFERFKLWMKKVYRDISSLHVELNDDIRGVFDRLLASDAEITRQARKQGTFKPMAQDIVGMTDAEYADYKEAETARLQHASMQTDLRVLKDRLREQEAWWKTERAEELEKAQQQYETLPARRAQQFLRGRDKSAGTSVALDRLAVVEAVGEDGAKKFQARKKGGEKPDTIAQLFGYATGKKMLVDVLELPEKAKWAKDTADDAMRTKYPDVLDERQKLADLVGRGLHGDMTERWVLKEWVALKRKISPPGSPVWSAQVAPIETLKLAAKKITGRTAIGKLNAGGVLAAERKAADAATKAAAKGDYGAAFMAKQDQLINMYLWRELTHARDERDSFIELAGEMSKDKARAKLGKARPVYRDFVDALLEALQLKEPSAETPGAGVAELITQMDRDGQTVGIDEAALNAVTVKPKGYKQLTVDEMRLVHDTLKSVKAAANGVNTALYEGKRIDVEELEQRLLEESTKKGITQPPVPSSPSAATDWQRFRGWIVGFDGSLLRPEQLLRMYMGDTWVRAMSDPLQNSKTRELDILKTAIRPVVDAFDKMPHRGSESIDGHELFPDHQVAYEQNLLPPAKRHELYVMALNAGNESNLARLLGGRNITLEQMQKALNLLSKEEMDWVQSVWDASESLWPMAAELEERDSGLAPKKLERRPVTTAAGTFAGGYFPAVYDWRVEQAGERQAAQTVAQMLDPRYVRPGTAQSHLKSRVDGFTGTIALEADAVKRALGQVAHDIAYREAVKSVGQLLLRPAIAAELNKRMGVERAGQLLQWAKDAGMLRGLDGQIRAGALMKLVKGLRGGTTIAVLGYSATTAAGDAANLFTAIPRTGIKLNHMSSALLEFMTNPKSSMAEAVGKSPELRARREGLLRKLTEQIRDLPKNSFVGLRAMRWIQDHAFAFLEATDALTSAPVWMGAYRQALMEGKEETEAVRAADSAIRDNFPGVGAVDLPGVLRDKGFVGQSLMFYRYFSVVYNSIRDIVHPLATAEDGTDIAKQMPRAAGRLFAFLSVALVFSELLSGRGPEDGEDWMQWYWRKLLFGAMSSVPIVGDAAAGLEANVLHKHINPRGNAVTNFFTQIGDGVTKLSADDDDSEKKAKALMQTLAPVMKLPISQPLRTLGGAAAQQSDPARNAAELGSDLYYGRRAGQAKNPLSIVGETIAGTPR